MVFIFANTLIMLMISHCYDTEQYILYSAFYFHACLPVFNSEKINFTTFLGSHNCSITCELFLEQGRRPTHSSLVTPVLKHQIRFPYTVLSKDYGDALWCFNPVFVFKLLLFIWDSRFIFAWQKHLSTFTCHVKMKVAFWVSWQCEAPFLRAYEQVQKNPQNLLSPTKNIMVFIFVC